MSCTPAKSIQKWNLFYKLTKWKSYYLRLWNFSLFTLGRRCGKDRKQSLFTVRTIPIGRMTFKNYLTVRVAAVNIATRPICSTRDSCDTMHQTCCDIRTVIYYLFYLPSLLLAVTQPAVYTILEKWVCLNYFRMENYKEHVKYLTTSHPRKKKCKKQ